MDKQIEKEGPVQDVIGDLTYEVINLKDRIKHLEGLLQWEQKKSAKLEKHLNAIGVVYDLYKAE